jgi:hypothetical protein
MIKKIISILTMLISLNASAGLFGASNYEECMSDGKVGRTNAELQVLKSKCERQFPKLPKLYALKDASISCEGKDTDGTVDYTISKNKLIISTEKPSFPILVRTKEKILIKGSFLRNEKINKDIFATLTIMPLTGLAFLEGTVDGANFFSSIRCEEN